MANLSINYGLPAKAQFFKLLNEMATETLAESDVTLSAPAEGTGGGNTDIEVKINRLVIRNPKLLHYNRVSMTDIFSLQNGVSLREIDLGLVDGFPNIDGNFISEFNVKYGFKIHPEDFTLTKTNKYQVALGVKDGNLAYTGGINVIIEKSLATRLPKTALDGFNDSQLTLVV